MLSHSSAIALMKEIFVARNEFAAAFTNSAVESVTIRGVPLASAGGVHLVEDARPPPACRPERKPVDQPVGVQRVVDRVALAEELLGATLPTIWAAGCVVGGGVLHGRAGGLVVAAGIVRRRPHRDRLAQPGGTWHNILLLFLLGGLDRARRRPRPCPGLQRYEQVLAERERLRERERLARVVHDGVLQTLAFIHRRGDEIGGRGRRAPALAADQERALRRLVSGRSPVVGPTPPPRSRGRRRDLRLLLGAHEGERVSVSLPGGPVPLEQSRAQELDAAVTAALDNVTRHAGEAPRPGCSSRTTATPSR